MKMTGLKENVYCILRIVSSSDSHPEDDLYVSGFTAIG